MPKEKQVLVRDDDEDKNLGRWVNRQRSMYQAGKLRKDRQLALEKIGLKWSMLATTSWDSMFETLCEFVSDKTRMGGKWDGNVPANYRTNHDPPRSLGRWINRQRSAYFKKKLKAEYEVRLTELGLKWSVHERRHNFKWSDSAKPDSTGSTNLVAGKSDDDDEYDDDDEKLDAEEGPVSAASETKVDAGNPSNDTDNEKNGEPAVLGGTPPQAGNGANSVENEKSLEDEGSNHVSCVVKPFADSNFHTIDEKIDTIDV